MKAAARLHYLALGCAVAPVLLVVVSCGGEGGEPLAAATTLASPTSLPPPQGTVMPTPEGSEPYRVGWTVPTSVPAVPMREADTVWQQIAASATLIKPVLRPTYLPPALTELRRLDSGLPLFFELVYSDVSRQKWLSLAAGGIGSTVLPSPRSQQDQMIIRGTLATYQLYDTMDPTGDASLLWEEPGRWGAPGDPTLPNLDHVTYYITCYGFSKDDLIKVADSLRPVEE